MSVKKPLTERQHNHQNQNNPSASAFENAAEAVRQLKPAKPLYILNTGTIIRTAQNFMNAFPGKALYAVKTNPDAKVIESLAQAGMTTFDVASLEEIRLVARVAPHAEMHFMHPIKAAEDIHAAYFEYGVRHFVLDHEDELFKIMRETELAQDLNLTVRVALPKNDTAMIDFSVKFGASFDETVDLLQKCGPVSRTLGLSFHVGTQNTDPAAYDRAINYCAQIIRTSGVDVGILNVGGGFPVRYTDDETIFNIESCVQVIRKALAREGLSEVELIAEPGRVLVAEAGSLVARVELRKGDLLYLNDGIYGGLFDASEWLKLQYPVQAVSCDRPFNGDVKAFRLAGPTCDSLDMLSGTYELPEDIGIGDWVIFGNTGAYSQSLRSDFNGFGSANYCYL